jgi:hypothetical protein
MVMSKSHYKECAMSTEMKTFEELREEAGMVIGDTVISTFVARAMMRGTSKNKIGESISELLNCAPEMTKSVAALAQMFRDYPELASQWWGSNIGNHRLWGVSCETKLISLCKEEFDPARKEEQPDPYVYAPPCVSKVSQKFMLAVASENGIYRIPLNNVWFQVDPSAIHPYVRFDQENPNEEAERILISTKKKGVFGKVEVYELVPTVHALIVVPSMDVLDKLLAPIRDELDKSMENKRLKNAKQWPQFSHLIQINTTLV